MNSRDKGVRGELELAEFLRDRGVEARRGQQHAGGTDSPDVKIETGFVHFECKRTEKFSLYDALDQARRDGGTKLPVVAHRRNRKEWVAIVPLDSLVELLKGAGML